MRPSSTTTPRAAPSARMAIGSLIQVRMPNGSLSFASEASRAPQGSCQRDRAAAPGHSPGPWHSACSLNEVQPGHRAPEKPHGDHAMTKLPLSRRRFLQVTAAGIASAGVGVARAADNVTIGIVYVGPRDDFGWNQAHAVAAKALKQVPGVKVVEEENVPETDACAKSMESMINLDGAGLILATSFGYYTPFVVDMAKKYPDVEFRHAAPLWNKDKDPKNAGSYFGYLNQAHYVNGVAAGLSTKANKIGFVAAKPIASVLSNINSVLLGARKTNPKATVQVIFTGDWSLPVREAEATNALVDAGCDVITCHVDSPKVT